MKPRPHYYPALAALCLSLVVFLVVSLASPAHAQPPESTTPAPDEAKIELEPVKRITLKLPLRFSARNARVLAPGLPPYRQQVETASDPARLPGAPTEVVRPPIPPGG